ncbi:hypothetical protein ACFOPQ_03245 [Deinococcus antarcticus]|uniref:Uncharacterized protein n=1 Tax=Deinococcus antarcticus TaxID=1298767 RepID=A0ABV8A5S3_9DEIO
MPYGLVSGTSIRYEQLAIPLMLLAIFISRKSLLVNLNRTSKSLAILWSIGFLSTTINTILSTSYKINYIPFLTFLNLIFFSILISSLDDYLKIRRIVFLAIICAATPAGIFAIAQSIKLPGILEITSNLYTSDSRGVVSNYIESSSSVFRAVSFFETPAYSATFFLCSIVIGIYLIYSESDKIIRFLTIMSICLSIAAGFFSFSATFIGGIALILATIIIFNIRKLSKILIMFAIILPIFYSFYNLISLEASFIANTNYQIERIVNGESFDTRFNESDGLITNTLDAIEEKPLIGWGWNSNDSVFVGDSLYIYLLYIFGLFGLSAIAIPMIINLYFSRINWSLYWIEAVIFILVILTGLGSPSLFAPRISLILWGIFSLWSSNLSANEEGNN